MGNTYGEMPGIDMPLVELSIDKARMVADVATRGPYTQFVGCRKLADGELLIIDVDVELGQRVIHDIQPTERLAIWFDKADNISPDILAIRTDFPQVPHLNLRESEYPKSLCLFDEPYEHLKLRWTAEMFVQRMRDWLAQTAKGILHNDDQPLEPLLPFSLDQLVIPYNAFSTEEQAALMTINDPIDGSSGRKTYIARPYRVEDRTSQKTSYIVLILGSDPQAHGIIHAVPKSLYALHNFMLKGGVDLLEYLRRQLKGDIPAELMDAKLILVVGFQKTRSVSSSVEDFDMRAFLMEESLRHVGAEIGVWANVDGHAIGRLLAIDISKCGEQVPIKLLNPMFSFSRESAAISNGLAAPIDNKLVAVGVGALGSNIVMNSVRMGIGQWVIIDNDTLLPHNLARHVLPNNAVGFPKATKMAQTINELFSCEPLARGIVANVMEGGSSSEEVTTVLNDADVIVDMAASIATSRFLVYNITSSARRISMFLNPGATDLVVMAEDANRVYPLDSLEMQYYRGLLHEQLLQEHLVVNSSRVRYANSCRDVSITMPQDLVALNSAIASRALRTLLENSEAALWVWHTNPGSYEVAKLVLPISEPVRYQFGEWTLITDQYLLNAVSEARKRALPNETGGVLIGSYDLSRKIVYVVDTILSPPDSIEWPTVYVRGCRGLRAQLYKVTSTTAGQLEYIGEWHSHPDNVECKPSNLDRQAFGWLTDLMLTGGLPPLMLITGQNQQHKFCLHSMEN